MEGPPLGIELPIPLMLLLILLLPMDPIGIELFIELLPMLFIELPGPGILIIGLPINEFVFELDRSLPDGVLLL